MIASLDGGIFPPQGYRAAPPCNGYPETAEGILCSGPDTNISQVSIVQYHLSISNLINVCCGAVPSELVKIDLEFGYVIFPIVEGGQ